MEDIVLVGFGGHAKSVIDSIERAKKFHIIGFTDIVAQKEYRGYKYLGNDDVLQKYFDEGIKCAAVTLGYMGTGKIRDYLYYRLKRIGFCLPVIIDSSSVLAEDVIIKEGTFVGKNCVINSASEIGSMCIINTGAVIEHESYVGDFSHVSVNATLCGSVMLGSFAECKGGRYCICCVTGPDEYNVLTDNNFYTNLMAREHLRDAAQAVRWLKEKGPAAYEKWKEKLDFQEEELTLWEEIAEKMYLPYEEKRGIYPLDDGFMMRKPWDESRIPAEKRAWLYENYHPLFIMRHRMSKQADAVLGLYLHSDLFSKEEIQRNYDFYQEVTLHHSSLSTCIFGIVACSIGRVEEAYDYFMQSARMDLDDHHNNFYAGIHAANMAGTWQTVVNGFGGMRCQGGRLSFEPGIPEKWEEYSFRVRYRGSVLEVTVTKEKVVFSLAEGEKVRIWVYGEEVEVEGKCEIRMERL